MRRANEIRARLEAATPGPWTSDWFQVHAESFKQLAIAVIREGDRAEANRNLALIAKAPADLEFLLARVERLEGLLREIREYRSVETARWFKAIDDALGDES